MSDPVHLSQVDVTDAPPDGLEAFIAKVDGFWDASAAVIRGARLGPSIDGLDRLVYVGGILAALALALLSVPLGFMMAVEQDSLVPAVAGVASGALLFFSTSLTTVLRRLPKHGLAGNQIRIRSYATLDFIGTVLLVFGVLGVLSGCFLVLDSLVRGLALVGGSLATSLYGLVLTAPERLNVTEGRDVSIGDELWSLLLLLHVNVVASLSGTIYGAMLIFVTLSSLYGGHAYLLGPSAIQGRVALAASSAMPLVAVGYSFLFLATYMMVATARLVHDNPIRVIALPLMLVPFALGSMIGS